MDPSSGIKFGELRRCPECGHDLWFKASTPLGAAPCPHCGNLVSLNSESDFKVETHRKLEVVELEVSDTSAANRLGPGTTVRILGGTFDTFEGVIDEVNEQEHWIRIMVEILAHRESWGLAFEKDGHADFHSGCVCFPNPERREQHVRGSVVSCDGGGWLLGG